MRITNSRLKSCIRVLKGLILVVLLTVQTGAAAPVDRGTETWRSQDCRPGGLFSERLELWREGRLWHMLEAEDNYLLSGFEDRPGIHPWQGEHVGKWLHAATLAYEQTKDGKLLEAIETTVNRLISTQDADGYMGTYRYRDTFMAMPENESILAVADDIAPQKDWKSRGGWDTWTLRYNLYGLLTYERYHPNAEVVEACKRMGDLLIQVYGKGKYDLTKYGTRQGISATTLLESIVMLYERTGEKKYLEFAEHIVTMSENNPKLRLMGNMLEGGSVVHSGDGKAYQLMANLLGYLRLYSCTNDERYLKTVLNGWQAIMTDHTFVTGGPWGRKMDYNGNRECFAYRKHFDPDHADVETCSTTTWVQLNLHLLEVTGEAKYAAEAERAVFNALLGAQYIEGIDWSYYTVANQGYQPFESKITCCASSGPRALEMYAHHLIGERTGALCFASLASADAQLSETFGNAKIRVNGNYPAGTSAEIKFVTGSGKRFPVEFREPDGSRLESVFINGNQVVAEKNDRGFYSLIRKWKSGDRIVVEFEYILDRHLEANWKGEKWVAFTYGPWALAAERRKGEDWKEPLLGKKVLSVPVSDLIEKEPSSNGDLPVFILKDTDVVLKTYFSTGSSETGPHTYFKYE